MRHPRHSTASDGGLSPPGASSGRGASDHRLLAALGAVLLLAALLRFEGLAWGLPDARHWFSYHPDEVMVLGAARRVNLFAGLWDPGFYNYGSLLIYLVSVVAQVVDAWSPVSAPYQEMARLTLIGRGIVALFGIATVYMTYLIGRRLGGARAGLLAAACVAVVPMHAVHSHFCTVDVPATFFVAMALYNALRWPQGRRAALWCGLAAGLAAGTKYNAGLALLGGWAAAGLARDAAPAVRMRAVAMMTGAAALAFLLSTPGVWLNTAAFLRDFGYETVHVRTGHGLVFVGTGPGWWYHVAHNLWQGVGAFLPAAALLALAVAVRRRPRVAGPDAMRTWLVLLAFALPYFGLISLAAVRFQRYDIPLLPVLAAGAAVLFAALRGRWLLLPGAAILGTLVLAQGDVSTMAAPSGEVQGQGARYHADPRDAVADWFEENVPAGTTVGLSRTPWFFSPPFSVANAGPQSSRLYAETAGQRRYALVTPDETGAAFQDWPEYVVLSDYEYGDALRLQKVPVPERLADVRAVPLRPDAPDEAARMARLWNNVLERYTVAGMWTPTLHATGLRWPKRGLPPHDAFYAYPTLIVFRRNG